MLLGNLIGRLQDETAAAEILVGLCDLALTARVTAMAAQQDMAPGELMAACVGRFIREAPSEEWTTVIGQMDRGTDPGAAFLRRAVEYSIRVDTSRHRNCDASRPLDEEMQF